MLEMYARNMYARNVYKLMLKLNSVVTNMHPNLRKDLGNQNKEKSCYQHVSKTLRYPSVDHFMFFLENNDNFKLST